MEVICPHCEGTGISPLNSETCHVCGGDGDIEAKGDHDITRAHAIVNYEKLLAVKTKLDALQADMDIIKPQIQAIYDDLNP